MSSDQRQHPRTPFSSRVKISHPDFGEAVVNTRDVSDGGIYVVAGSELTLEIGTVISVQIQDTPMEAPVLEMVVVRGDSEGYGLEFVT